MSGVPGKFQMGTEMILFEGQKQEFRIYNSTVNTTVHRTSTLYSLLCSQPCLSSDVVFRLQCIWVLCLDPVLHSRLWSGFTWPVLWALNSGRPDSLASWELQSTLLENNLTMTCQPILPGHTTLSVCRRGHNCQYCHQQSTQQVRTYAVASVWLCLAPNWFLQRL